MLAAEIPLQTLPERLSFTPSVPSRQRPASQFQPRIRIRRRLCCLYLILTRQTSDRIIASIDNSNYYYANTLHGTSLPEESLSKGFTLEYILALFNSKLMNYIYTVITGEVGKTFAQIKIDTLRKLPISEDPNNEKSIKLKLLAEVLANKNDGNVESIAHEIDRLIYDLYGLTEASISYIEQRYLELCGE